MNTRRFKFDLNKSVAKNLREAESAGAKVGDRVVVDSRLYYKRIDARKQKDARSARVSTGTKWVKIISSKLRVARAYG